MSNSIVHVIPNGGIVPTLTLKLGIFALGVYDSLDDIEPKVQINGVEEYCIAPFCAIVYDDSDALIGDILGRVKYCVCKRKSGQDVYLVFDFYPAGSVKSQDRIHIPKFPVVARIRRTTVGDVEHLVKCLLLEALED